MKCPRCKVKDVLMWDGGTGTWEMDYYCEDWGICNFMVHSITWATVGRLAEDAVPVPRI